VKIEVCTADITTKEGCKQLIESANKLGPVGGIFNLAVVLSDTSFQKQSAEGFQKCFKPKALSTKYLDEVSRILCPELDHFVFFSSVSCGRGNGAQTNYGLSNSFGEKIIEKRRSDDLCGKAVQFGPISNVGLLSKVDKHFTDFYGYSFQTIQSCCEVLDEVLLRNEVIFSSMVCASKSKISTTFEDAYKIMLERLDITDESSIDQNQTLAEFGVDSISGVEIQQFLQRELGITRTLKEVRALSFKEAKEVCRNAMK
jgi:fatty acid synthase, animal type